MMTEKSALIFAMIIVMFGLRLCLLPLWWSGLWQSLRADLFGLVDRSLNRANREAVEPTVVVLRIDTATAEAQVPTIRSRAER